MADLSSGKPPPSVLAQAAAVAAGEDISSTVGVDIRNDVEDQVEEPPPPAYGQSYGLMNLVQEGMTTSAEVADDGRLDIRIDEKSRRLSELLMPTLRKQLNLSQGPESLPPGYIPESLIGAPGQAPPPPMNIVIHVVGSRGDVQPFVALGQVLKNTYKHRVRLATHPTFREFVQENGLEFFSISGDPAELMAFMVKNPGLFPGKDAMRDGEIGRRRKGMYEIIQGCWRSCYESGDGTGMEINDKQMPQPGGINTDDSTQQPFIADAIIANPPSYAHIHCAEKLGIPLHLMFTMPWSPTQSFPHPLANIQSSNADPNVTNFLTYALVEMMTWQGLGDLVNNFRQKKLGLEPIGLTMAPGMTSRLKIPYTYCWSPALIPKPRDWSHHISISGFYFLSLAQNFRPASDLQSFLDAGPPPVYIGFGSIVIADPNAMTRLIFEAVKKTGHRALVSKGWGGFGADDIGIPEGVFMLGNVPHDWLFKRVSCVVHHGGAGTTAAGIALGKPTVVVPFFGDQPFWGAMIAKAGAGPAPIHNKKLTADNLAAAILEALKPATLEKAEALGKSIASETGSETGAKSFHSNLNVDAMRCSLAPSRTAVWHVRGTSTRLSAFSAAVLGGEDLLNFKDLKLYRSRDYEVEASPWEPITGAASALIGTIGSLMGGAMDVPVDLFRSSSNRPAEGSVSTSRSANSAGNQVSDDAVNNETSPGNQEPPKRSAALPPKTDAQAAIEGAGFKSSLDSAVDAGKGVSRIVSAGLKSPMDFTLALAQGFHNAPKLYGDQNVRKVEPITGMESGLRVAGKEFGYGLFDGITGLVTQPLEGAKKEGFTGFLKGFGKGIGGVALKPAAGFWGIPGYASKGIYKELQKRFGSSVENYVIAARTAQGYAELQESNSEERLDVIKRWRAIRPSLTAGKKDRRRHHGKSTDGDFPGPSSDSASARRLVDEEPTVELTPSNFGRPGAEDEIEHAIRASVAATSNGNAEEDAMVEQAIRASILEVQQTAQQNDTDDDAFQAALKASITEASRGISGSSRHGPSDATHQGVTGDISSRLRQPSKHNDVVDDKDIPSDEDENIRQAIKNSMADERTHGASPARPSLTQHLSEEEVIINDVMASCLK